ncbi:MAG: glycosyltransferase family 2 protein [Nitrospirae bacterium]|nr:glycosyltransferase family 2 protein [Nitrospirota bacterium]
MALKLSGNASPEYSIVIPVLNSSRSLVPLYEELKNVFDERRAAFELILINDGSTDSSWEVIKQLHDKDPNVRGFNLSKNFGQHNATMCGLLHARGQYMITMDSDLQHDPKDIFVMRSKLDEGYDCIIGSIPDKKHSFLKVLSSRIMDYLNTKFIGKPKDIKLSSFRIISRYLVEEFNKIKTPFAFFPAMLFSTTSKVANSDITHRPSYLGKSSYTLGKLVKLASNLIINNSSILLRNVAVIGILSSIISGSLAVIIIIKKIFWGIGVSGWTSLFVAMLFQGGIILLSLGIIGEYLVRIIKQQTDNRYFVIREKIE